MLSGDCRVPFTTISYLLPLGLAHSITHFSERDIQCQPTVAYIGAKPNKAHAKLACSEQRHILSVQFLLFDSTVNHFRSAPASYIMARVYMKFEVLITLFLICLRDIECTHK